MAQVICVRVIWNRQAIPLHLPDYRDIYVDPEPGFPFGRKGMQLAGAWRQLGDGCDGMLFLDGDVAIDPHDHALMFGRIHNDPGSVWTAPARIWPVSTHYDSWVWGHWQDQASQDCDLTARWFSFCYTYLPRRLLDSCCANGLRGWTFPIVDASVAKRARAMRIPCRVAVEVRPVHCHF